MSWHLAGFLLVTVLAAVAVNGDKAGDQFMRCCDEKGITCRDHMCIHPPPERSVWDDFCLAWFFASYVHCATGGKDNRDCCRKADVTMGGQHPQCLDLCYDSSPTPGPWYKFCDDRAKQIDKCNHDANN